METIILSIAIPSISGLAWLAYKHHNGYLELFPYLVWIGNVVLFYFTVKNYFLEQGFYVAYKFLEGEEFIEARSVLDSMMYPYSRAFFFWILYFLCLSFFAYVLPEIIKEKS